MGEVLPERIRRSLTEAMKAQEKPRISTLRLMSAALKERIIQNRGAGRGEVIADAEVLEVLAKMIRQREESAQTYAAAGRGELADQERREIAIIREFMPSRMDEAEVRAAIETLIREIGASGVKDMGRTMAALKERFAGQMDFAKASRTVKELLG